jgi:arsenate reductase
MSTPAPYKLLVLCTGNSARSILGEYLLRRLAPARFETFSAGVNPTGKVNPYALRVLKEVYKIDASDARSKHTDEVKDIHFDFVITVCDNAKETCPIWPGQPIIAHWGVPDPAAVEGTDEEKLKAFVQAAFTLNRRFELFTSLPLEKLDRLKLEEATRGVAKQT